MIDGTLCFFTVLSSTASMPVTLGKSVAVVIVLALVS